LFQLKEYHTSGNKKFNNLGIFQRLKLRNLMGKILRMSLWLNFPTNTLGCCGLSLEMFDEVERTFLSLYEKKIQFLFIFFTM